MAQDDEKYYTYRVVWSDEDGEFVGLCAEFPSLSWLDEKQTGALEGIQRVVKDVLGDMRKKGESAPEPMSRHPYSGQIRVRLSPQLHRRLAVEAAEKSMSLNRLINTKLSVG
jgi:predicted HicB family RNase H-like nuclease